LYLLPNIISHLDKSSILVIDELDAHLHPAIIKKILELFHSELNKKSQIIFTSHDIMNMTNDNFRRDEIWFLFRNERLESQLVCLSDFIDYKGEKIRKDAKYSKQYMKGKYGADPFIRQGLIISKR